MGDGIVATITFAGELCPVVGSHEGIFPGQIISRWTPIEKTTLHAPGASISEKNQTAKALLHSALKSHQSDHRRVNRCQAAKPESQNQSVN